jgi:hypothetical protein
MTTYSELLPATKSSQHNGIRWTPSATEQGGHLLIDTKRTRSEYLVAEFPAANGRGFHFAKVSGHTDPTATSEDVFIGTGRRFCSCRGYARTGDCKHVEAVVAILENNWLPAPVCEPAKPARRDWSGIDAEFA